MTSRISIEEAKRQIFDARNVQTSKGKQAYHRKTVMTSVDELPDWQRCSRCVKLGRTGWQPGENFGTRKNKLKSGVVSITYRNECRRCERERQALRRQDPKVREQNAERARRWAKSEKGKRYYREWHRMKRIENGANPRGPVKKYRHEVGNQMELVPVRPFVDWWLSLNGSRPSETEMGEALSRAVRRAVYGDQDSGPAETRRMRLDTVDEVGVLVGQPHLIYLLYT